MSLEVRCTDCDVLYKVPDKAAGKKIRCRKCDGLLNVPGPATITIRSEGRSLARRDQTGQERRDQALFGDAGDDGDPIESHQVTSRKPRRDPKKRPLPPKNAPSVASSDENAAPGRPRARSRRPQVGGSTKDKLVFAGGMLAVFVVLGAFFPFALYLVGLMFYWLAYIWVVGDAYEDDTDRSPVTGSLFVLFRLLTRPLHLWPAWVFGALGVLSMIVASGQLPWLRTN